MSRTTTANPVFEEDTSVLRFEESEDISSSYDSRSNHINADSSADPDGHGPTDLRKKQEELLHLRHALEQKEREATHLELRRQKEERFTNGRRDMGERFSRALVKLERELYNAHKAIEEISIAKNSFDRHLDILRSLQPEAWQRANLDAELDHALASIEDAEDEYDKTMRRIVSILPQDQVTTAPTPTHFAPAPAIVQSVGIPTDFREQLRYGFAFTLPLGGIVLVAIILARILFR
jgi:chromosome segregation ATPase